MASTASTTPPPAPNALPALLDVPEVLRHVPIGRTKLYDELAAGRLRSVRVGRRRLVPAEALAAYITLLIDEADQ